VTQPRGIAIGIPAHDEGAHIDRALHAVLRAAPDGLPVVIVVAADSCRDETAAIARTRMSRVPRNVQTRVVSIDARCAGIAREAACRAADALLRLQVGAPEARWIATTDADTVVPADWLETHCRWAAHGADAVAGLVRVDPLDPLPRTVRRMIERELDAHASSPHPHVFGANIGMRAAWWYAVGGFPPIPVGEDQLIIQRLRAAGARVMAVSDSVVTTSGRLDPRAPAGFGAHLAALTRLETPVPALGRPCSRQGGCAR
jgi:cellulose synthase/poly-beta-1,6-N-acetylglucosamine synthase-like glycosyltransferase